MLFLASRTALPRRRRTGVAVPMWVGCRWRAHLADKGQGPVR